MREKYESLPVGTLRELAKFRGIRGISALKKADLVQVMLDRDEMDKKGETESKIEEVEAKLNEALAAKAAKGAGRGRPPKSPENIALAEKEEYQNTEDTEQIHLDISENINNSTDIDNSNISEKSEKVLDTDNDNTSDTSAPVKKSPASVDTRIRKDLGRSSGAHNLIRTPRQGIQSARPVTGRPMRPAMRLPEEIPDTESAKAVSKQFVQPTQNQPTQNQNRQNTINPRPNLASKPIAQKSAVLRPVTPKTEDNEPAEVTEPYDPDRENTELDSGITANGILEVMPDGYGFIRSANYLPGENDVYVSPSQIRRFNLSTGDILRGNTRIKTQGEKFSALLYVSAVNGFPPVEGVKRPQFENMVPIFPNERLRMERPGGSVAMRIVDLISPVGKGQRGMIVSPPKAGKTTLLKDIAKSILSNNPEMHIIILLIDERPEEVTDIREAIRGHNVEVIYSTFDELPEHHKRVSEMVIERAKRLVELNRDVCILLDSITRMARAYNLTVPPSGRTLSGGLDPAALHMPKRFFGAARNMRDGGSLTILATGLVETGSKMDDVVYEEFKGTGNMELVLDRKLQEKRVFPAIDIQKSGTRREDLLFTKEEKEAVDIMRRALNGMKAEEAVENILSMFSRTSTNEDFIRMIKNQKFL